MATIPPDQAVDLRPDESSNLRFPPPSVGILYVAVHHLALRAGNRNLLTLLAVLAGSTVESVGAIDERMLASAASAPSSSSTRAMVARRLFLGARLWQVVRPGLLTMAAASRPYLTVYDNDRPWVVVGELANGAVLAAPLNDARGNPKWWAPQLAQTELTFPGSKDSQLELAHLWALPAPPSAVGTIANAVRARVQEEIKEYFK